MPTKSAIVLLTVFVFCLCVSVSLSLAQDLETIHAAILHHGARWVAGETSISRLAPSERRMRVGLIKPVATAAEQVMTAATDATTGLTATLDWRNNGGNYVTPVRDQGSCGSCWAFATTAALESVSLIVGETPNADLDLAEQVLLSCGNSGSCAGGYIDEASDYLRGTGLPLESCYPYTGTDGRCGSACANWTVSAQKILSWSWVSTQTPSVDALKTALNMYGPLVTTMDVYADFYNYTSGIYSYVSGTYEGGHAVLLVGYDDPGQYFIVKNSWGTGWGEAGYFRIAYSELTTLVQFGWWTIGYQHSAPSPVCAAPPLNATPGSPSATITTATPTYTWNAVPCASWYYLWVNDSINIWLQQWYTAEQAGCASGTGTCSVTPTTVLNNGPVRWWIQTWDSAGYGPWSAAMEFTVDAGCAALPPAATLGSPSGTITTATPTYTWNAVPCASWYYLWVNDSINIWLQQWYTAEQAGCASGTGTCSVTPTTVLNNGAVRWWWIQTWSSAGYGPWSAAMEFTVGPLGSRKGNGTPH